MILSIDPVDQIIMEFRPHKILRLEILFESLLIPANVDHCY